MTFEQRMAELGVDLSDMPKNLAGGPEPYPLSMLSKANGAAWDWYLDIGSDMENYDSTRSKMVLKLYILHLTDIIDRMETRIVNLTGDVDYLVERYGDVTSDCKACSYYGEDGDCYNEQTYCSFDFAGVPEYWRPDDA